MKPSIVVISAPVASTVKTVHDFTVTPFKITVHAPQLPVAHPRWVPVNPRWSRKKSTSKVRVSTFAAHVVLLTVRCTGDSIALAPW